MEDRRTGVLHVATRIVDKGERLEDIASDYRLDFAAIHHALAYYYDYPDDMQEWRRKKHQTAERVKEQQLDPEKFRQHT